MTAAEREKAKEQLRHWKEEKQRKKLSLDQQEAAPPKPKRREDSKRREIKEQIEEYRFRKEMD